MARALHAAPAAAAPATTSADVASSHVPFWDPAASAVHQRRHPASNGEKTVAARAGDFLSLILMKTFTSDKTSEITPPVKRAGLGGAHGGW